MKRNKKEKWEYKLSHSQLRFLHNLALGFPSDTGVRGMSARGGFTQTYLSLLKRGLLRAPIYRLGGKQCRSEMLTMEGVIMHRRRCCLRGRTEDDQMAYEVEEKLNSEFPHRSNLLNVSR